MFELEPDTQFPSLCFLSFMREADEAINRARRVDCPTYKIAKRLTTYLEHYERLVSRLEPGKGTEKWGKAYDRAVLQRDRIRDVALPEAHALNAALEELEDTMNVMADDIMCLSYTLPRDEEG